MKYENTYIKYAWIKTNPNEIKSNKCLKQPVRWRSNVKKKQLHTHPIKLYNHSPYISKSKLNHIYQNSSYQSFKMYKCMNIQTKFFGMLCNSHRPRSRKQKSPKLKARKPKATFVLKKKQQTIYPFCSRKKKSGFFGIIFELLFCVKAAILFTIFKTKYTNMQKHKLEISKYIM